MAKQAWTLGLGIGLATLLASTVAAQTPAASDGAQAAATPAQLARGEAAFKDRCKDCHDPAVGEAPEKAALAAKKPDEIFSILKSGLMQPMADGLSDDDMHAIAAYLTASAGK